MIKHRAPKIVTAITTTSSEDNPITQPTFKSLQQVHTIQLEFKSKRDRIQNNSRDKHGLQFDSKKPHQFIQEIKSIVETQLWGAISAKIIVLLLLGTMFYC